MKVEIKGDKAVLRLAKNIKNFNTKVALEDCTTIFESSTKAGYMQQRGPGGEQWPENPEWWQKMKGHSTPLTGITAGGRSKPSPPWVAKGNKEQMKNQLIHKVTRDEATVYYKGEAVERAAINQAGGIAEMTVFHFKNPSIQTVWKINVQKREHLGIAEHFKRTGGKTDTEHFEDVFVRHIDKTMRRMGI